jgi:hypothetical protein
MNCVTCAAPAAAEMTTCDKAWACDVRANTLLCETCAHPYWMHGAEHDGPCYAGDGCRCKHWKPGPVASHLCIACGGALGPNEKERHRDREWCREWEFWIECGNCRHPFNAHDLESMSCLGTDDLCKCTKWKPVPKMAFVDQSTQDVTDDIPEDEDDELDDVGT